MALASGGASDAAPLCTECWGSVPQHAVRLGARMPGDIGAAEGAQQLDGAGVERLQARVLDLPFAGDGQG